MGFKFKVGDVLKEKGFQTLFRYKVMELVPKNNLGDSFYDLERQLSGNDDLIKLSYSKTFVETTFELESEAIGCYHDWKEYRGFNNDYEYCTKCDIKRNNK